MPWTAASTAARWRLIGTSVFCLAAGVASQVEAQPAGARVEIGGLVAEAAQRFGLPESWIRAVMHVESAFQVRAVSPAGAMGLMQVMPQTYAELRSRYGLGADPFQPRDNILAGAAYLREMYDRFGVGGFLAAYNAGPARYQQHLIDGRPLPSETRAYVAKLSPSVLGTPAAGALATGASPLTAPPASLFVVVRDERAGSLDASSGGQTIAPDPAHSPLFAALTPRLEDR